MYTRLIRALYRLAQYTRSLEEEIDGPDAGEGDALVHANAVLADIPDLDTILGPLLNDRDQP